MSFLFQVYAAEGVSSQHIEFQDNKPCVQLIEKNGGILALLDDACMVKGKKKNPDEAFCRRVVQSHKKDPFFEASRFDQNCFIVKHFAGDVTYNVEGFVEKNTDALHSDLDLLLSNSEHEFARTVYVGQLPAAQSGGRGVKQQRQAAQRRTKMPSTVGTKFKDQLKALNKELLATDPHYVRCIKSNSVKQPMNFMRRMVLDQLLYSGVLETVRIRRMGYPYRDTWANFWKVCQQERFDHCVHPAVAAGTEAKDAVAFILGEAFPQEGGDKWQLGHTKVFLKHGVLQEMKEWQRSIVIHTLQRWYRGARHMRRFRKMRRAVKALQRQMRALIVKKKYARQLVKIVMLQSQFRRFFATTRVRALLEAERERVREEERLAELARIAEEERLAEEARLAELARLAEEERLAKEAAAEAERLRLEAEAEAERLRLEEQEVQWRLWGSVMVQKTYRMHRAKNVFRALIADRDLGAAVFLQAAMRGMMERARFHTLILGVTKYQANWRRHGVMKRQRVRSDARKIVINACRSFYLARKLHDWVEDLHASCLWGRADAIESILRNEEEEYSVLSR